MNNLGAGGAEVSLLNLAKGLVERGFTVDLVVCEAKGPLLNRVPEGVRLIGLKAIPNLLARVLVMIADPMGIPAYARAILLPRKAPHRLGYLWHLTRYLKAERPDGMIAALPTPNMLAVWAKRLAGVDTKVVVSQRNALSQTMQEAAHKWRKRYLPQALSRAFSLADTIVAVSDGVGQDLAAQTTLPLDRIKTVYNPIVSPELADAAKKPSGHDWLDRKTKPVLLTVGALIEQKDHATLLHAFAKLRSTEDARLVIVGSGKTEAATQDALSGYRALAGQLGIADDVDFPGFSDNVYAFMARADVFVLSSRYEGLPGVLIQALACGCPAVSTDCPHGPREILQDGDYGRLVPVGDADALADGMRHVLHNLPERALQQEGASRFTIEQAAGNYLKMLQLPEKPASQP